MERKEAKDVSNEASLGSDHGGQVPFWKANSKINRVGKRKRTIKIDEVLGRKKMG
jgi:hypothetical protein